MDSSTTIDESTNMPIPIARPPSDMMLSDTLRRFSGANVTKIEIGMLSAMIAVVRMSRKNSSNTITARIPPMIAVLTTSLILLSMKTERSATTRSLASSSLNNLPASVGPRKSFFIFSRCNSRWLFVLSSFLLLEVGTSPTSAMTRLATATMLASASL